MDTKAGITKRPVCLVLMPMYAGFEDIRASIARALNEGGVEMCRLEEEAPDYEWHLWLLDSIERSDIVLADMTDHNPFVMYELGVVHQSRVLSILIMNAADGKLPATVRGSVYLPYANNFDLFERALIHNLNELLLLPSDEVKSTSKVTNVGQTEYYQKASALADRFILESGQTLMKVTQSVFNCRMAVTTRRGESLSTTANRKALGRFLLALILQDSDKVHVMKSIRAWISDT